MLMHMCLAGPHAAQLMQHAYFGAQVLVERTSDGVAKAEYHLSSSGAEVHISSTEHRSSCSSEDRAASKPGADSRAAANTGGAPDGVRSGAAGGAHANGDGGSGSGSGGDSGGREARVSALIERALRDDPSNHLRPNDARVRPWLGKQHQCLYQRLCSLL